MFVSEIKTKAIMKTLFKSLSKEEQKQHAKLFIIDLYLFIIAPILATILLITL